MDEQKDNQDLVVDENGEMDQGIAIEVKKGNVTPTDPEVNELTPPDDIAVEENPTETEVSPTVNAPESEVVQETSSGVVFEEAEDEIDKSDISGGDNSSEQTPTPMNEALVAAASAESATNVGSHNTGQTKASGDHRNNKKLAILVTVLVALLLAGAVVYVYISAQSNTKQSSNTSQSADDSAQAESTVPATTGDIDQTTTEVDEAVNALDDSADFSEESLDDSSLGL